MPQANEDGEPSGSCSKNWGYTLRAMGCAVSIALIVVCVLDVITFTIKINMIFLDVYMTIIGLGTLLAELRSTSILKGLGFSIVKYIYFINTHTGRGIVYLFLGSCNLDVGGVFRLILGISMMGVGLIFIMVSACVSDLPRYRDKEIDDPKDSRDKARSRGGSRAPGKEMGQDRLDRVDRDRDVETGSYSYEEERAAMERQYEEGHKKHAKRDRDAYKINPFGDASPYSAAGVAATVVKNGDAPAVARAVARGDNVSAAATVTRSVVLGPTSSSSSAAPLTQQKAHDSDDDFKKKRQENDDDEIERMYAQMRSK